MGALNNYFKPQFLGYGQSEVALDGLIAERDAAEGRRRDNRFGMDALTRGTIYQQARFGFSPAPPPGGPVVSPGGALTGSLPGNTRATAPQEKKITQPLPAQEPGLAAAGDDENPKSKKIADFVLEGEADGKTIYKDEASGITVKQNQRETNRYLGTKLPILPGVKHDVELPGGRHIAVTVEGRKMVALTEKGVIYGALDEEHVVSINNFAPPLRGDAKRRAEKTGVKPKFYPVSGGEGFWRLSVEQGGRSLVEDFDSFGNWLGGQKNHYALRDPELRLAEESRETLAAAAREKAVLESPDLFPRFRQGRFDSGDPMLRKSLAPEAAAVAEGMQAVAGVNGARMTDMVYYSDVLHNVVRNHITIKPAMQPEHFFGIITRMDPELRLLAISCYIDDKKVANRLLAESGYVYNLDALLDLTGSTGKDLSGVAQMALQKDAKAAFGQAITEAREKGKPTIAIDDEQVAGRVVQMVKKFNDLAANEGLYPMDTHLWERGVDAIAGMATSVPAKLRILGAYAANGQDPRTVLNQIEQYRESGEMSPTVFALENGFGDMMQGFTDSPADWDRLEEAIHRRHLDALERYVSEKRAEAIRRDTYGNPTSESAFVRLFEGGVEVTVKTAVFAALAKYKGAEWAKQVIGGLDIAAIASTALSELTYEEKNPVEVGVNAWKQLFLNKVNEILVGNCANTLWIENKTIIKSFENILSLPNGH